MTQPLHTLFHQIATTGSERELRSHLMDALGDLFGAQRWGIHLLDSQSHLSDFDVKGLPDSFIERYEQIGRTVDPVMSYVVEHHIPAHEQIVLTAESWKRCELYQRCCSSYNHEHIMTGPIVGNGGLIGTLHFARINGTVAFNAENLATLSAVCAHVSAAFAMLRAQPNRYNLQSLSRLTPRELQIAKLVAQGLTNAEIGAELWIAQNSVKQALKRMFRKLEISARTELVTRLYVRE